MTYFEPEHTYNLISDISVLPFSLPQPTRGEKTSLKGKFELSDTFFIPTFKGRV